MPLICPSGFDTCTTRLAARERYRKNDTDDGAPGYFSLTLDNEIKMEATATRRAGQMARRAMTPRAKRMEV